MKSDAHGCWRKLPPKADTSAKASMTLCISVVVHILLCQTSEPLSDYPSLRHHLDFKFFFCLFFFFPVKEQQMTSEVVPAMISQKRQSVATVHNLHSLKTPPPLLTSFAWDETNSPLVNQYWQRTTWTMTRIYWFSVLQKKPWQWRLLKLSLSLNTHARTHAHIQAQMSAHNCLTFE